jgi:hypothetical protein
VHQNCRWNLDYGGGHLINWFDHYLDIAHWGLGFDYTGPYEIEGQGEFPKDGLWKAPTKYRLKAQYAKGVTIIVTGEYEDIGIVTKWIGENRWVHVNRDRIDTRHAELLREKFRLNDIHLFRSPGHHHNFLDCVKSRRLTLAPCEVSHVQGKTGLIIYR